MFKKNIILGALVLTVCTAAALTSCGNNGMNDNAGDANGERVTNATDNADKNEKETVGNNGNVIGGVEGGAEDIGSDIKDSINNPEDATHGPEDNDTPVENGPVAGPETDMPGAAARHRQPITRGK